MKNNILLFCFVFLVGCATMESIDQYYDQINWNDGISRDEAAIIAKKYLVESKYAGDFQVLGPKSQMIDNFWQISFLYKSLNNYEKVLNVYVDVKSGEVVDTKIVENPTPDLWENGKY